MNEQAHELYSRLNSKIKIRIEDELLEAFDLIYNYAHKYSFREDVLAELEPSEVKRLVSRYFKNIESEFVDDFLYEIRTKFAKLDQDRDNTNKLLSENDIEDLMSYELNRTINRGLDNMDSDFIRDFKSEAMYSFRSSALNNPDFDYIFTTFKRNLLSYIEDTMQEFKKRSVRGVIKDILDVKEEYLSSLPKEKGEEKIQTKNDFDIRILDIYAKYTNEIESSFTANTRFHDLLAYFETTIKNSHGLLTQSQIDEFNKLYELLNKEIEDYKKEQDKLNSKIKPIEKIKQEENVQISEQVQTEDNEFHIVM